MHLSRRRIIKNAFFAALFSSAYSISQANSANKQAFAGGEKLPLLLSEFDYGQITFAENTLQEKQFKHTLSVILNLDENALLKPFRKRAGLPAPGDDLGGWYDEDPAYNLETGYEHGFAPGHSFGQWLAALCRAYAISGKEEMKEKALRLISLYSKCISPEFYKDFRWPTYTFDKINLGLIDAHKYLHFENAFEILNQTLEAAVPAFPEKALDHDEMRARPHKNEAYCWDESYTLPENLFLAYQRGAGKKYKELAIKYLKDDTYFNPLSQGKNILADHHAYSYTNALSSAMQAYITLGSQNYFQAAKNAFEMIRSTQSFATGGWGPDETFRKTGSNDMAESLTKTHNSFETPCGSYAHFKITRYLLRATKEAKYGDSMEEVMYNTVLGAKELQPDGHAFYYSDYNFEGKKFYHKSSWTCCSGSLPLIVSDYRISSYFHDDEGIFVNLYINSSLKWLQKSKDSKGDLVRAVEMRLSQQSDYPISETITFKIETDFPCKASIRLRIPEWAKNQSLLLNGQKLGTARILTGSEAENKGSANSYTEDGSGFACIERVWKNGDCLELKLPMELRLQELDSNHPELVALKRGPLVLFAITDKKPLASREELLAARPGEKTGEWVLELKQEKIRLLPFTSIQDEKYSTYFQLQS